MKFWRPGITGKLFLAIFATCIVLLISMHWAVRISFERGFIGTPLCRSSCISTDWSTRHVSPP